MLLLVRLPFVLLALVLLNDVQADLLKNGANSIGSASGSQDTHPSSNQHAETHWLQRRRSVRDHEAPNPVAVTSGQARARRLRRRETVVDPTPALEITRQDSGYPNQVSSGSETSKKRPSTDPVPNGGGGGRLDSKASFSQANDRSSGASGFDTAKTPKLSTIPGERGSFSSRFTNVMPWSKSTTSWSLPWSMPWSKTATPSNTAEGSRFFPTAQTKPAGSVGAAGQVGDASGSTAGGPKNPVRRQSKWQPTLSTIPEERPLFSTIPEERASFSTNPGERASFSSRFTNAMPWSKSTTTWSMPWSKPSTTSNTAGGTRFLPTAQTWQQWTNKAGRWWFKGLDKSGRSPATTVPVSGMGKPPRMPTASVPTTGAARPLTGKAGVWAGTASFLKGLAGKIHIF